MLAEATLLETKQLRLELFTVTHEDDENVPEGMVDVQDQTGNTFGPFKTRKEAKEFMRTEARDQKENGYTVTIEGEEV
jgi:hypothetical protein